MRVAILQRSHFVSPSENHLASSRHTNLLLHFPQALHTAEQVAAPQHEAAKVATWRCVVSPALPQAVAGERIQYQSSVEREAVSTIMRPSYPADECRRAEGKSVVGAEEEPGWCCE
jgi:hypothetical protein